MNYYKQGDAANAQQIKSAFEKLGINVLEFGFADKTVVYCSIGGCGGCVQYIPYSINLMHILHSHPGYKELELDLPAQSKFKVGDWIVRGEGFVYEPSLITEIRDYYICELLNGERVTYTLNDVHKNFHLWTIQDAKDGDVLATDNIICIFKKLDKDGYYIISPCIYTVKDGLEVIDDEDDTIGSCGFKPATKEDRELLFRKMKEASYEWDAEKKELKKIQPHYNISNFKAGMPVLIRNYNNNQWEFTFFGRYQKDKEYPFRCADSYTHIQCIPYEGNEHLLGTTDMCDEQYINW